MILTRTELTVSSPFSVLSQLSSSSTLEVSTHLFALSSKGMSYFLYSIQLLRLKSEPLTYSAISSGFINEENRNFMLFVDEDSEDPAFDWGEAALAAINKWEADGAGGGKAFSLEWPAEKREQLQ